MDRTWWQDFFDVDYLHVWGGFMPAERTREEAEAIWKLFALEPGRRVLDAPCGYGRISRLLAERGACVVGVDQSRALLDEAERTRGDLPPERLRYVRHDLREPLAEGGFDVAINVFSSLGYGSEADDVHILRTLGAALRPGGRLLVETNHRDAFVAFLSRVRRPAARLPDGTLLVEEPRFDAIAGRVETTWYWSGPRGSGQKSASLRLYTVTELVQLLERAGLSFRDALMGISSIPFAPAGGSSDVGGRLGLVAERPG